MKPGVDAADADDGPCWVARIETIERARAGDGPWDAGTPLFRASWFFRPKDTHLRPHSGGGAGDGVTSAMALELFASTDSDLNPIATICGACDVVHVAADDDLTVQRLQREGEADGGGGGGACKRCGEGARRFFRRWYDPRTRAFTVAAAAATAVVPPVSLVPEKAPTLEGGSAAAHDPFFGRLAVGGWRNDEGDVRLLERLMLADGPTRERAVLMLREKLPPAGGPLPPPHAAPPPEAECVDAAAAAAAERRASLLRRVGVLNVSLEAKLLALNDHTTALRKDKAFRHMGLDRRLKIAVRRDDVVASVCRAFAAIKGPSIFKATDVRFVGESGVDRGGISSEMISVFFDALLPAAAAAGDAGSTSDAPDEAAEAPALFEAGDDAGLGWLPARGLVARGPEHAERLQAVGRVLCKCLLELHLSPPSSRRCSSPPSHTTARTTSSLARSSPRPTHTPPSNPSSTIGRRKRRPCATSSPRPSPPTRLSPSATFWATRRTSSRLLCRPRRRPRRRRAQLI